MLCSDTSAYYQWLLALQDAGGSIRKSMEELDSKIPLGLHK